MKGVKRVMVGAALAAALSAHADEFDDLRREIDASRAWNQPRLVLEAARRDALILPEDRTPCDVVCRRTAALLSRRA